MQAAASQIARTAAAEDGYATAFVPPEWVLVALRKGKRLDRHMGNFFECVRDRALPVSDVYTHHRALSTCHLANIALRLGRKLSWDPAAERMVGDTEASTFLARPERKGYETTG